MRCGKVWWKGLHGWVYRYKGLKDAVARRTGVDFFECGGGSISGTAWSGSVDFKLGRVVVSLGAGLGFSKLWYMDSDKGRSREPATQYSTERTSNFISIHPTSNYLKHPGTAKLKFPQKHQKLTCIRLSIDAGLNSHAQTNAFPTSQSVGYVV